MYSFLFYSYSQVLQMGNKKGTKKDRAAVSVAGNSYIRKDAYPQGSNFRARQQTRQVPVEQQAAGAAIAQRARAPSGQQDLQAAGRAVRKNIFVPGVSIVVTIVLPVLYYIF